MAAAPADGAANRALVGVLADALAIPKGRVRVASGTMSRLKIVAIEGISPARVAARWPGLLG